MKSINVKRTDLIAKVEENRAKHIEEFDAAFKAWRDEQASKLDAASIKLSNSPAEFNLLHYALQQPTSHVADYDRALEMLRMSVDDVIAIDNAEFRQLACDEWSWQQSFKAVTTSYLGGR